MFVHAINNFNDQAANWWSNEMATTKGTKIDLLTTSYGFIQIISDQTNILPNCSSYDDLILTNQTNWIIESGFHPFLHPQCYHQIIFVKLTQHEKCPYSELLWYKFSRIRNEYGETLLNWVRENTDQNNSEYGLFLHSVSLKISTLRYVKV